MNDHEVGGLCAGDAEERGGRSKRMNGWQAEAVGGISGETHGGAPDPRLRTGEKIDPTMRERRAHGEFRIERDGGGVIANPKNGDGVTRRTEGGRFFHDAWITGKGTVGED
jgi:hypothetical protein